MYSILLHLLLLSTACCRISNATHTQQQVYLQGAQLSVTVRARKMKFSPSTTNEQKIFSANSTRETERLNSNSANFNHANETKILTTTKEQANRANYRKSRIIVKDRFNDAALKLPTGFRPAAAPRNPLLYPFEEKLLPRNKTKNLRAKTIISNEDWTPIAYVLEPIETEKRRVLKFSSTIRSTKRPLSKTEASMEPREGTVIYGAQRKRDEKKSLAVDNGHDINFLQEVQARNAQADNTIYSAGTLANFDQQHSERIKQRKGTAVKEKLQRKIQVTVDGKENSTNKTEENIAMNMEEQREQKKPVKNIEMTNMNNPSTVTMKISLRASKNATMTNESSSSSSVSSIAGHSKAITMSTQQMPFKWNETTWPLSDETLATTSAVEAALADASFKLLSSELSTSSSKSSLSTSSTVTSSSETLSSTLPTSTSNTNHTVTKSSRAAFSTLSSSKAETSSTSSTISETLAPFLSSTVHPASTPSNNFTTVEPKICVPMLVRENSFANPAEFIELERIVCFPLPPDADLNFVESTEDPLKGAAKDRSSHEDLWNSRMNSGGGCVDKNWLLLYLTVFYWLM